MRTWWRHQAETFSALLALCAGNSPVTGEFPSQRPVARSFDVCSSICPWINGWVNNREAGDLRSHSGHYDVSVMITSGWIWLRWGNSLLMANTRSTVTQNDIHLSAVNTTDKVIVGEFIFLAHLDARNCQYARTHAHTQINVDWVYSSSSTRCTKLPAHSLSKHTHTLSQNIVNMPKFMHIYSHINCCIWT